MLQRWLVVSVFVACSLAIPQLTLAQATRQSETYKRIKLKLDAVPAIDTHDHLWPFDRLPGYRETKLGKGMNLASIWGNSYWTQVGRLTPWQPNMEFDDWWKDAKDDWDNSRATSFYRYTQIALKDLYGVDWDRVTDEQARELVGNACGGSSDSADRNLQTDQGEDRCRAGDRHARSSLAVREVAGLSRDEARQGDECRRHLGEQLLDSGRAADSVAAEDGVR